MSCKACNPFGSDDSLCDDCQARYDNDLKNRIFPKELCEEARCKEFFTSSVWRDIEHNKLKISVTAKGTGYRQWTKERLIQEYMGEIKEKIDGANELARRHAYKLSEKGQAEIDEAITKAEVMLSSLY